MKANPSSILIFGHDAPLMETRQWVLQSRGYRVLTTTDLAGIRTVPQLPPIKLLLLCHTLSQNECEAALHLATERWPDVKNLALVADNNRHPSGILGQLIHTMHGPAKLISMVGNLIGANERPPDTRAS